MNHEIPCIVCRTMFDPIDSDYFCSTTCMRANIRREIADEVITLLATKPELVEEIEQTRDFVVVEERVSLRLDQSLTFADENLETESFNQTCELVFDWLKKARCIDPPRWFVEARGQQSLFPQQAQ